MMRGLLFKAVVGRVADFPFALCLWGREKRVGGGQKRCNITWGYVA